jgi:putative ABC transport system substrate-binding protein
VFVQIPDPVGAGLLPSVGRPTGNITGFINFDYAIVGKWLETLKEIVPDLAVVLLLQNPTHFGWPSYLKAVEGPAASLSVSVTPGPAHDAAEIEQKVASFAQRRNGGMIVFASHDDQRSPQADRRIGRAASVAGDLPLPLFRN